MYAVCSFLPAVFPTFGSCSSVAFSSYYFLKFFRTVDNDSLLSISEIGALTDAGLSMLAVVR